MLGSKAGRPAKWQYKCILCKAVCSPRDGDWIDNKQAVGNQVFVCHKCERQFKATAASR